MKNLLIITQKVDSEDDLLGFFVKWIREFAKHYDCVYVIAFSKGKYDLPDNVTVNSLGKEHGTSKISQFFTYYSLLFRYVPRSAAIFAHMSPIFVVSSWPLAVIFRKRIVLWYLHRSVTLRLKIAEKLCYKIVTAAKESLDLKSRKIIETGHGIDAGYFKSAHNPQPEIYKQVRILCVARISPAKRCEILIRAGKILRENGMNFRITIVGRPVMPSDHVYLQHLQSEIVNNKLENYISLAGFVPYSRILDYYRRTDIAVNLTNGGIDKVVLESMAAGCLTITSNPVFNKYLGIYAEDLIFKYDDPEDLAGKIIAISILPLEKREAISRFLSATIADKHSISKTINVISSFLQ